MRCLETADTRLGLTDEEKRQREEFVKRGRDFQESQS
jgi:hypothetical protein